MQQDQRLDDEMTLSGLDRLTQRAALAVSRRGFMKRLATMGAAIGIGIVTTTKPASACTADFWEYRSITDNCGTCSETSQGRRKSRRDQRRSCRICSGGVKNCGLWATYQTTCLYC